MICHYADLREDSFEAPALRTDVSRDQDPDLNFRVLAESEGQRSCAASSWCCGDKVWDPHPASLRLRLPDLPAHGENRSCQSLRVFYQKKGDDGNELLHHSYFKQRQRELE